MADRKKTAAFWNKEIIRSSRVEKSWRIKGNEIVAKFRNDSNNSQAFNILFSNTQTIKPAIYSATPKPDVRPRHAVITDNNVPPEVQQAQKLREETAANVSEVIERALVFAIDSYDFDRSVEASVDDMLLPGRGTVRVRYFPTIEEVMEEREEMGLDEFGEERVNVVEEAVERIADQRVECEYVYWEDLRMGSSRSWVDVPWVAFRHKFTRDQWIEEFDEEFVDQADFSFSVDDGEDESERGNRTKKQKDSSDNLAIVWEIWDSETREIKWISSGIRKFISEDEDPLNLEGFYPIPEPLYSVETTDTLVPVPLYEIYRVLAEELNTVQKRIIKLTNGLKLRGVYPNNLTEVQGMLQMGDNEMLGVTDFTIFEGRKLSDVIMFAPVEEIARVIVSLTAQRESIKQVIFEVTGISDILRGATKASETLGAQQIKASFGTARLENLAKRVRIFARDLIRMKAEIIADKFTPEILQLMTGMQITPEMEAMLDSDVLRNFNIDIETDSTVAIDRSGEKEELRELLTGIVGYLTGIGPIVQSGIMSVDVAKDILLASINTFSNSRAIADAVERIGEGQGQPLPQPGQVPGQPSQVPVQPQGLQAVPQAPQGAPIGQV